MTNEEIKNKIVEVLNTVQDFGYKSLVTYYHDKTSTGSEVGNNVSNDNVADALIAAGIGDVKRHRVFVSKDGKEVKQFYSGEEVENILKERNELKVELRDKVDYIHEQDEVIKEYKHRAEVAERALKIASIKIATMVDEDTPDCKLCQNYKNCNLTVGLCSEYMEKYYLEQAEKELAEGNGGKKEV